MSGSLLLLLSVLEGRPFLVRSPWGFSSFSFFEPTHPRSPSKTGDAWMLRELDSLQYLPGHRSQRGKNATVNWFLTKVTKRRV